MCGGCFYPKSGSYEIKYIRKFRKIPIHVRLLHGLVSFSLLKFAKNFLLKRDRICKKVCNAKVLLKSVDCTQRAVLR